MMMRWRIQPIDTWFFREARAHDAVGVGHLGSLFPPPAATLLGAIRTCLGDGLGVNWHAFAAHQASEDIHALLGDSQQPGQVQIHTVQLCLQRDGQTIPLYPAPTDLLKAIKPPPHPDGRAFELTRLVIGQPVRCDLGEVALPSLPDGVGAGCKPLEQAWLTHAGLSTWLNGQIPDATEVYFQHDLVTAEPRIGIGRDVRSGSVKEGLLYQTLHLRPKPDTGFAVDVYITGLPEDYATQLPAQTTLRLGGEARPASVQISPAEPPDRPLPTEHHPTPRGLTLMLTSPAYFAHASGDTPPWCLPEFRACHNDAGRTAYWQGELAGIPLNLISCAQDRPVRMGGWDQKRRHSKPLTSLINPGTVFYCELADDTTAWQQAIQALQGKIRLGQDLALGYGQVMVGLWPR